MRQKPFLVLKKDVPKCEPSTVHLNILDSLFNPQQSSQAYIFNTWDKVLPVCLGANLHSTSPSPCALYKTKHQNTFQEIRSPTLIDSCLG